MRRSRIPTQKILVLVVLLAFLARTVTPAVAAPSPVRLNGWSGTIDYVPGGATAFTMEGTGSHIGKFTAYGEVDLVPTAATAEGVVVFKTANGDLLVGVTTWDLINDEGTDLAGIHFSWRDSVEFSDETVVSSTGRFADSTNRPPGLVVIAIIAILIGLLVPAIQK